MNPIIIPQSYVNKSFDFYIDYIKNNPATFSIRYDNNIKPIINDIRHNNNRTNSNFIIQNLLYFLYRYTIEDNIINPLDRIDGGRPKEGFELFNKFKGKGTGFDYGVYHCHLSSLDSSILIWYPIITDNMKYFLQIEYLIHPKNHLGYVKYVKDIYYRNDGGYHNDKFDYFSELHHLLSNILYENKIMKFDEYLIKYKRD